MVSTRHHPKSFPAPATSTGTSPSPPPDSPISVVVPSPQKRKANRSGTKQSDVTQHTYSHKIAPLLMIWLFVSLPLVTWDTGYMLMRPHTMPGGKLHSPIWTPYALYGTVDYIYGWPAWDNHVGFSAAQASLNAVENVMYIYYLITILGNGAQNFFAAETMGEFFVGSKSNTVSGPGVAKAVLLLFAATVMTLSKTVLYWLNEYFSGYSNIGHNTVYRLIVLWILPNGLWLIFPTYMIWVLGKEIVAHMDSVDAE
ncbi:hypothetical protein LTS17_004079 [Exophiala oligosperma]